MKKSTFLIVFVAVLCFCFCSCNKDKVYEHRESFPDNAWERIEKGKTITFSDIEIEDTTAVYDIILTLRHTPFINEKQVKVLMKTIYPSGITRESIHTIKLRDRFDKEWVGDAMGDMIDVEEPVKKFISLPEKGNYTITITNLGRYSKMVGIMDLGVRVNKSNPKEYKNVE
ncbi:MAG: hypothetical protein HUK18_02780 [Bacteroidales bacterium]|nr:hypothetical protein [Bacteroidales bacterium]